MSSLIPGYEYDIFISYRQKDNKHDGWVTEFVDNLKGELESTFKEEVSVYFDINPHDGLLETHDVDASLKDKLKCLIFIPIISRTYCDPKSFAWEHEFKAFVEQASNDQFGLKVKLPNGNVASRVLPIQIHDLKSEDKVLVEKELGGFIRAIEFIYKESGVNRPLTPKDSEEKNSNKTNYRNQINKVANAIDEIISGLKAEPNITVKEKTPSAKESVKEGKKEEKKEQQEKPLKLNKLKLISGVAILAILIIAALFSYPKIFIRDTLEKLRSSGERISVAVMPFQNMTNDTTKDFWQKMIQDNLITNLSNSPEELTIRQTGSISSLIQSKSLTNYSSITPSLASNFSQKLDANIFVYGSINQIGTTLRLNAQLMNAKTEAILKSFQVEGTAEGILPIIDSLSLMIKNYLIISILNKEVTPDFKHLLRPTNSPEAYHYFILGENAHLKRDYPATWNWFSQAIAIDSNFYLATIMLSMAYADVGVYDQAKKLCLRVYKKRALMPPDLQLTTNVAYAFLFETPYEEINYLNQLLEIDDQIPFYYYLLGWAYRQLNQNDKAISEFENALKIYKKWESKPTWDDNYTWLGFAYHQTHQYNKEKELYKKAEQDFPNNPLVIQRQAILSYTEGDTVAANQYIEKYISALKEKSSSESDIKYGLAKIYSEAGALDKAEECYRQALSLEPDNFWNLNNLAYFLVDKDRNVHEGMELINNALKINSDSYLYMLDTKGWALYKEEKYLEARDVFQKSWDLRIKNAIYNHEAYLHLEAAKKAVAGQK